MGQGPHIRMTSLFNNDLNATWKMDTCFAELRLLLLLCLMRKGAEVIYMLFFPQAHGIDMNWQDLAKRELFQN